MKKFGYLFFMAILAVFSTMSNAQTLTQKFYLDFGKTDVVNGSPTVNSDINGNYWNNIESSENGSPSTKAAGYIVSLVNSENKATSYLLKTTTDFRANGKNNGALLSPNSALLGDLAIPSATEDYFFIENNQHNKGEFILQNLDATKAYKFYVFGSRSGDAERTSIFSINGTNGSHSTHQTTGLNIGTDITNTNDNNIWESGFVVPNSDGEICFEVGIYAGGFAYINAVKIEEYSNYSLPVVENKLYIDFGKNNDGLDGTLTANPDKNGNYWNNLYSNGDGPTSGAENPSLELIYANNQETNNYFLETGNTFSFNGVRNGGLLSPDNELLMDLAIATATQDYLFIDNNHSSAILNFKNLDAEKRYRFNIFGSRFQSSGDPRIGFIEITGANTIKGLHQMGGENMDGEGIHQNTKNIFISDPITPDINNQITLTLKRWLGGFAHINAIKIEEIEAGQRPTSIEIDGNDISFCGLTSQMRIKVTPEGSTYPAATWSIDNNEIARITQDGTLYPIANGIVTVEATVNYSDETKLTASKQITISNQNIPDFSLAIMGSSVPAGTGAETNKGYAHLWSQWLMQESSKDWTVTNISIGGNTTTDVTNRWDNDFLPTCSKYIYYGLSLGNEGIHEKGQSAFDSYHDNMLLLIERARLNGKVPLMGNNYPRGDFNAIDYNYLKELNLIIHQWDVPSINLLGAIDNGEGRWADGYISDNAHPNTAGHAEMFYAVVPTLLDALANGKPQPHRADEVTKISLEKTSTVKRISFVPENVLHSFTFAFSFKTNSTGTLASLRNSDQSTASLEINTNGQLVYETESTDRKLTSLAAINDGQWHQISLTHYYAWGKTILYLDGLQVEDMITEKLTPEFFSLNDFTQTLNEVDFRELFFYRAGMNIEEIQALNEGKMLKSSLEIYAPLDESGTITSEPLANLAQSLNVLVYEEKVGTGLIELRNNLFDNNDFKEISVYSIAGQRLYYITAPSPNFLDKLPAGVYIVKAIRKDGSIYTKKIIVN